MARQAQADLTYLTVKDVATYLLLPEETVYKYVRSGRLPGFKVGRHWRFTREAIDQWTTSLAQNSQSPLSILVVDDDPTISRLIERWLLDAGHHVSIAMGGEEAIKQIYEHSPFDIICLDLIMPETDGIHVLRAIREMMPQSKVIVLTGAQDPKIISRALDLGPLMVVKKPINKETFFSLLQSKHSVGNN